MPSCKPLEVDFLPKCAGGTSTTTLHPERMNNKQKPNQIFFHNIPHDNIINFMFQLSFFGFRLMIIE